MKTRKLFETIKDDRGYVFVEASIVYPVMFFVLIFLIYMGNMFLLRARIDSTVAEEAITYANYFANPYVKYLEDHEYTVDTTARNSDLTNNLYRYFYTFGDFGKGDEKTALAEKIGKVGLFNNITPSDIVVNRHGVNNFIVYQTYEVSATYKLQFPIKFIFMDEKWSLNMTAREEAPVTDQAEFIRNLDMAVDYAERTDKGTKAIEEFSKLKMKFDEFVDKVGGTTS